MKREHDGEGGYTAKQAKCPNCGSKKLVFEKLSEKAVELGAASAGFMVGYRMTERMIGEQQAQHDQPMGGKVPVVIVVEDICYDCHTVYAPFIKTGAGEKAPKEKKLHRLGDG